MDRVYHFSRAIVQFVNRYEKNERNARDKWLIKHCINGITRVCRIWKYFVLSAMRTAIMNSHNRYGRMSDCIIQSSETRCSSVNEGKEIYDIIRPQQLLSLDDIDSIIQYFTTHIELRSLSRQSNKRAVTRIRTWVIAATTQCTNHYTITAMHKSVDFIGVYTRNV